MQFMWFLKLEVIKGVTILRSYVHQQVTNEKNVEKLLGLRSDSNFKDKINIFSLILGLILGILSVMFYLIWNLEGAQVLIYPLGLCFLVWFATRRNGCGSCNQVSN